MAATRHSGKLILLCLEYPARPTATKIPEDPEAALEQCAQIANDLKRRIGYSRLVKRTIEVLNRLEQDGVFFRYAIGGAMGAIFYTEPFLTFDLDVFVVLPQTAARLLTLAPIYDALRAHGYNEKENECILIEDVPVQFLPAYNALVVEALSEAQDTKYEDVPTRVVRPEYLVAIALQTGRSKDRERVRILREQAQLDRELLADVLKRHQLEEKWKEWTE